MSVQARSPRRSTVIARRSPGPPALGAQIICIVDVYDALTTTRSYRGAMSNAEALARMEECLHWWRPDVYAAFLRTVGTVAIAA